MSNATADAGLRKARSALLGADASGERLSDVNACGLSDVELRFWAAASGQLDLVEDF